MHPIIEYLVRLDRPDADKYPLWVQLTAAGSTAMLIGTCATAATENRALPAHEPTHMELYQASNSSAALQISADSGLLFVSQRVGVMGAPTQLLSDLGIPEQVDG